MIGVLFAASASPGSADGTCLNAAVRAESGSSTLPDCRVYEMVTPPYKEGFPVGEFRYNDDGLVAYRSLGSFAGNARGTAPNLYHATRSTAGWMTTAMSPSNTVYDTGGGTVADASDLRWGFVRMSRRAVPGDTPGWWRRAADGGFTRIGDGLAELYFSGASADVSHIVFNHGPQGSGLSEYVGFGNEAAPRSVTVDNHGQEAQAVSCYASMSDDGRVIMFTSGCGTNSARLWARVGGSATVAVSGSECTRGAADPGGACNGFSPSTYVGRSADGSRVFFTTSQQLINSDTDDSNDLYACDIPSGAPVPVGSANPCASLIEVSGAATSAQVENVVAVSPDGARVYFVAHGVLARNLGVDGVSASTGGNNLYVWERDSTHPAGKTTYVASLAVNDISQAQSTPDARFLLFVTANQLVTKGPAADTDGAVDAYRYDAAAHSIARVSTAVSGSGGNNQDFNVTLATNSSITANGSTVVFDTAEALSEDDTNGLTDVYSWHDDGRVALISAGGGNSVGVSASGRDIFFSSNARVLPADGDFNIDLYDARIDGGFRLAPEPSPCSGDGCQGQPSQSPNLAQSTPVLLGHAGGIQASPAFSLRAVSAAQRRALAANGRISLVVTTNAPGTITAKATATIAGRLNASVGSARRTLTAPGKATLFLTLAGKSRAQLTARGRLSVKIAVGHSKVALDRAITVRLVKVKAKLRQTARRASVQRVIAESGS